MSLKGPNPRDGDKGAIPRIMLRGVLLILLSPQCECIRIAILDHRRRSRVGPA